LKTNIERYPINIETGIKMIPMILSQSEDDFSFEINKKRKSKELLPKISVFIVFINFMP